MLIFIILICIFLFLYADISDKSTISSSEKNRYFPYDGGWMIHIEKDGATDKTLEPAIGLAQDNPRLHRRPLYPPADRTMVWSEDELQVIERCSFRPLILAYNEPRFLFDFHSAGGLLGHLYVGLIIDNSKSKWLHQWSDLDISYTNGRMEYKIQDEDFPGAIVQLTATPLAESASLIVKVKVIGLKKNASLVWGYGGASAFFTNYNMDSPEFTFSPSHCSKDSISINDNNFSLIRAFDETDSYLEQKFAVVRHLPDWKAIVTGGSTSAGRTGFGDPEAFATSPAELIAATDWTASGTKQNCVAVQEIQLTNKASEIYIAVGMGGNINNALNGLEKAFEAALVRNKSIAERIVTNTPDPYLDAAMLMMAFATEGTWGDSAILHGGWSWRYAYLGWRGWYGPDCYGWTDRVKKSILSHTRLGLVKQKEDTDGLGALLEDTPRIYYNMNEVFLDHIRHYFDYTNDLELMQEIFPVLEGIVEWENRRLKPNDEYLYENALNTWISDSHWYIQGQCTQASAYMLQAHNLLADLARRLGKDDSKFKERAEKISSAMQQKLWMKRPGVFAEYLDTTGNKMLHTEPELPTIYHSVEFGAADNIQIYQMLHWVDTHIKTEETPNGGKLYWSSNWYPNNGRSFTHSTYDMVYAEGLNLALTNYLAGCTEKGYSIIKSTLCGIFNGPTPGGLSCHSYTDGRQRVNDEFSDTISMWGRTICEGLFGIKLKRPDGYIELAPQFPDDWPEASITTSHFSYKWKRGNGIQEIEWKSPVETSVHLRLPICAKNIDKVQIDGKDTNFNVQPGLDFTWLEVATPAATNGNIKVYYTSTTPGNLKETTIKQGDRFSICLPDANVIGFIDPQGVLSNGSFENGVLQGKVVCEPGTALLFISIGGDCPKLIPVSFKVEPNTPEAPKKVWSAPQASRDLEAWTVIDLSNTFNSSLTEAIQHVADSATHPPLPASQVGFTYWKSHLTSYCLKRPDAPTDTAWRNKVGKDGIAWTADGIPFKTSKDGANIGIVTLAGGFPSKLEFSVNAKGKVLYLMISGMTFPVQSHVVNLRVTLCYADGQENKHDLVNPFDIGDCWSVWFSRWHDTAANGFENIGGRFGPAGSIEVKDLTQPVSVDTEAHLVPFSLCTGKELKSIEIEVVANDVIFGVMGAAVLK